MQHLPSLSAEAIKALEAGDPQALIDFHRLTFGDWHMEDDGEGEEKPDDEADEEEESEDDSDKLKPEDDPNSIEYWKKRSRQNEREARKAKRERDEAKKAATAKPKDGDGADNEKPDVDKIREEAKAEAAAEALRGRVEDKIEAKARAFADPEDAVAVLLRSHDIEDFIDDGKVDVDEIVEALKDLAEKKPHLLAQGKKFEGGGDGGARSTKPGRPKDLGEALSRRLSGAK